jgi:molybdopterin synthase sulfur carrier subunit
MEVKVLIPSQLRPLARGADEVLVSGANVGDALTDLERRFPGIGARIRDEKGALRKFVNVFVRDEDVRFLNGLETSLAEGDSLMIVPAVAGG